MVRLPTPPWARRRERCPNCLAKLPDDRALVCDVCGYQLRVPRIALAGLVLIGGAVGALFMGVFGGDIIPFPGIPFGLKIPFLEHPTPADLRALSLWVGGGFLVAGSALAYAGAYAVRRKGERVLARGA